MDSSADSTGVHKSGLRALPAAVAALFVCASLTVGCSPEEKRYVPNSLGGELTPTMATTDVTTLISDSGYTRYKITTPNWLMFEDASEPFWKFPVGLELEQYDADMNPESNVICDSATYFSRMRLWRLDGNVVMVNTLRDSFLTQQLFWDQNSQKIYSDSFIHIVRSDRIIEGYGFESTQNMMEYTVHKPTAILPAERRPGSHMQTETDSSSDRGDKMGPNSNLKPRRQAPPPAAAPPSGPATARAVTVPADSAKKGNNTPPKPMKLTPAK